MNEHNAETLIGAEHLASLAIYEDVLNLIKVSGDPLIPDLQSNLNVAYKDLTESVFNEMLVTGLTAGSEALSQKIGELMLEALGQIKVQEHSGDGERLLVVTELFKGLMDVYLLIRELEFVE